MLAAHLRQVQIDRVISTTPAPPYALAVPRFRFRALAALAGRAPLGGSREIALAVFLLARLVDDARRRDGDATARRTRAAAAQSWLSALALPSSVREPMARLAEATGGDLDTVRRALAAVAEVTGKLLDTPSRAELERLAQTLSE